MEAIKKLYRYSDECFREFCGIDDSVKNIKPEVYRVRGFTKCGVWIDYPIDFGGLGKGKFILLKGKKRFAYPAKQEALKSYIMRKLRQEKILVAKMRTCAKNLSLAEKLMEETK